MDLSDLQSFTARAAAEGRALCPAVILIGGVEYDAAIPEPALVANLILGGEIGDGGIVARVLVEDLPEAPELHQEIRWKRPGEADWRPLVHTLSEARRAPMDSEWRLVCPPKN